MSRSSRRHAQDSGSHRCKWITLALIVVAVALVNTTEKGWIVLRTIKDAGRSTVRGTIARLAAGGGAASSGRGPFSSSTSNSTAAVVTLASDPTEGISIAGTAATGASEDAVTFRATEMTVSNVSDTTVASKHLEEGIHISTSTMMTTSTLAPPPQQPASLQLIAEPQHPVAALLTGDRQLPNAGKSVRHRCSSTSLKAGMSEAELEERRVFCLQHTLLVISAVRGGRVASIERYRRNFWDLLYVTPKDRQAHEEIIARNAPRYKCTAGSAPQYKDIPDNDRPYRCLADVLQSLDRGIKRRKNGDWPEWAKNLRKDGRDSVVGVVWAHFDFWLTPTFPNRCGTRCGRTICERCPNPGIYSFDEVWGLYYKCTDKRTAARSPFWIDSARSARGRAMKGGSCIRAVDEAHRRMNRTFPQLGIKPAYCSGWGDMFYMPRSEWDLYSAGIAIMNSVGLKSGHNEIYLPILLHWITHSKRRTRLRDLQCWGTCCMTAKDPVLMHNFSCGHRIWWPHKGMKLAFDKLWDDHWQAVGAAGNFV
eukprot:gnl/TRDRNA2_/TRDRNA2_81933_c0_seq1.p1 gnl/TRDRNA2_/TRDRNA2_81933_c0~~gnl/TRDRNA2_/TRDRNA2_81933_c0_seq1.p1  ORF type:complete len:536 (+),score=47.54 gnl/TRDRNA2_/TRDRNA2_81933_c0_seq1:167-1774(+)